MSGTTIFYVKASIAIILACCSDQPVNICPLDPLKLCFVQILFVHYTVFYLYVALHELRTGSRLLLLSTLDKP
jgi:hypothetical protein